MDEESSRRNFVSAARRGDIQTVKLLLDEGADRNYRDKFGRTVLMIAAWNGHVNVVQLLLSRGDDCNVSGKYGWTALMHAAWKGHVNVVEHLLTRGAECNVRDEYGQTPLMYAAEKGHVNVARLLLTSGADCNVSGNNGRTALMKAAEEGHVKVVKELLAVQADCNATDKREFSALLLAAKNNRDEIVDMLLDSGADPNVSDEDGRTPLMFATRARKDSTILSLVALGANCNKRDIFGVNALMIAVGHRNHKIVQILLDHGADVTLTDLDGQTVLTAAVKSDRKETLDILLQHLSRLLYSDGNSNNQSAASIETQSSELFINKQDNIGNTPLHYAVQKKNKEIVQLLLEHRSDSGICNKNGDTPLHMAANAHLVLRSGIVQLLVEHGINIDKKNIKGLTALDLYINLVNEVAINDEFKKTVGYFLGVKSKIQKADFVIEHLKPNEEDVAKCKKVTDVLNIEFLGNLPENSENVDIKQKVASLMDELCKEIKRKNPKFECSAVLVGSTSSGTKIALPDECDYLIVLSKFSEEVSVQRTGTLGLVRIFNPIDGAHLPISLKSDFEPVACEAMAKINTNEQNLSVAGIEYNKVCLNFRLVYHGHKHLPVSVDVSPAIKISEGKSKASTSVSSSDTQQEESNQSPPPLHAVCKPLSNISDKSLWSLSSSQRESCLIKVLPESRKSVLRLMKVLMKEELYGKPKVFNDHDSKTDDVNIGNLFNYVTFQPSKIIDGYLLKTAFLHEVKRVSNDNWWEGEENNIKRVQCILRYVSTCCRIKSMPHCMLKYVNILEEYKRKKIEGAPLLYLTSLIADSIRKHVKDNTVPTKKGVASLNDRQVRDLYLQIRETKLQKARIQDEGLRKFNVAWKKFEVDI